MIDINEDELHTLIGQMDERIGKEGAIVRLDVQYEDDGTVIVANHLGYLRLGVEFLKAAYVPLRMDAEGSDAIDVDLAYLFGQRSICYRFGRRENDLPAPEAGPGEGAMPAFVGVGCLLVGAFLFASLIAGMPIVAEAVLGTLSYAAGIVF